MQRLAKARIAFHFCAKPDDFTAEIWILRRDEARAAQQIRMGGCDCAVLERSGFSAVFDGLWKRPVLLILLAAAITAAILVPKFVFFYEVEGNEAVPSAQILRELQELGVGFGTYGPSIKPQELKKSDASAHSEAAVADRAAERHVRASWSCGNGRQRARSGPKSTPERNRGARRRSDARGGCGRKLPLCAGASCCKRRVAGVRLYGFRL